MARNPMNLPGMKKFPGNLNDKNLNSTLPMPANPAPMSTDRLASPASLAQPQQALNMDQGQLSPRAARFRKLAGILGHKK